MKNYIKIGRNILIGQGFSAKHWSGPVVFGPEAIYIFPNASERALLAGYDSGAAMAGVLGAVVGAIAATANRGHQPESDWKARVVNMLALPPEVLTSSDWPIKKKKRPVIVLTRDSVECIERKRGWLLLFAHGEIFKLGMKFFGRATVLKAVSDLGWLDEGKNGQPGATDNPDGAQRLREDY